VALRDRLPSFLRPLLNDPRQLPRPPGQLPPPPPGVEQTAPELLSNIIADRLNASGLSPGDQHKALGMMDRAVVYTMGAEPGDRLTREPTIQSIAAEWSSLGVSPEQGEKFADISIDHTAGRGVVEVRARDWWDDQRAAILDAPGSARHKEAAIEALGPEPSDDARVWLSGNGQRVEQPSVELQPAEVERPLTEERADRDERAIGLEQDEPTLEPAGLEL